MGDWEFHRLKGNLEESCSFHGKGEKWTSAGSLERGNYRDLDLVHRTWEKSMAWAEASLDKFMNRKHLSLILVMKQGGLWALTVCMENRNRRCLGKGRKLETWVHMWNKRKGVSLVMLMEDSMENVRSADIWRKETAEGTNVKEKRNSDNRHGHWVDFSEWWFC